MNAVVQHMVTLATLEERLRKAKATEEAARKERVAIEELIVGRFAPPAGAEGTAKEGGLTVTWKVTRKVDTDALQAAWSSIGANAQKAIKWKADVDLRSLRALQDMDVDGYGQIANFITTTPAKPAVTLKEQA
jgi:hypothetical protein